MNPQQAYNQWATTYDDVANKTRDLEAIAFRQKISGINFSSCLEIGCGTGKNTEWLVENNKLVTAVDLSLEMLALAQKKITSPNVNFIQADVNQEWKFTIQQYGLISFSLVLEHIKDLSQIFKKASAALKTGGKIYIGELHPFKQYNGSKARFQTEEGTQIVDCFNHHISDFIKAALPYQLNLLDIDEYFDEETENEIPRILTLLFEKK